jgi:hypothetical protein
VVYAYIIAKTMPKRGIFTENQKKLDFKTKISDFFYCGSPGRPLRGSKGVPNPVTEPVFAVLPAF